MKFTKIAAAVLMSVGSLSAQAAIETVTTMSITGGDFNMGGDYSTGACGAAGPFGSWQCLTGTGTIDTNDGQFEGPSLTAFNFFGAPVTTFTAATAAGAANSTSGNPLEGTVDTTAGTISMDFGSFYAAWSGSNFLQAPGSSSGALSPIVTGSYDSNSGAFDLSWSSYITTAPFADQTGYWHLTGTVTTAPVPEASTYGMMLAGLGLVGFAVRRRKLMA